MGWTPPLIGETVEIKTFDDDEFWTGRFISILSLCENRYFVEVEDQEDIIYIPIDQIQMIKKPKKSKFKLVKSDQPTNVVDVNED